jgi:CRISPR-associated protein Csx16
LEEALLAANHAAPRFVRIPMGREPRELWQQFDAIKTELRGGDGTVMLDITHGFRSQPFFAASVAAFVHAVDRKPPDLRVCYAAYEAKNRSWASHRSGS